MAGPSPEKLQALGINKVLIIEKKDGTRSKALLRHIDGAGLHVRGSHGYKAVIPLDSFTEIRRIYPVSG